MTDPEAEYRRLVSGDEAAITSIEETLHATARRLPRATDGLVEAERIVVWRGDGAAAFVGRAAGLRYGVAATGQALTQAQGALATAAHAYATAVAHADHYISFWRNRPADLPWLVEEIFARLVNAFLLRVGVTYNQQLAAVEATLAGDEVDLDQLDEETRKWVEEGMRRNEQWLSGSGSGSELGPMIPNIAAVGDGRGWIPQGLGYDPDSHTLVQSYYTKDGVSYLALIDEITGREVSEVRLGGEYVPAPGVAGDAVSDRPEHAGGVSIDGDDVYVVDHGTLFTYSLAELREGSADRKVEPIKPPQGISGGSYSAIHDGKLYVGSFQKDQDGTGTLYEYTKVDGEWVKTDEVVTPPIVQGVVVRDDQFVFSTSHGRSSENGSLIVQDRHTGERSEPYPLPNMAEGVVEVDGEILTTYESGAGDYDHYELGTGGWWWGKDDHAGLWANPYLTRTPLSDLGLSGEVVIEPATLVAAAGMLGAPADVLATQSGVLDSVRVSSHILGQVPHAASLSRAVDRLIDEVAQSLRTGARSIAGAGELLRATAADHERVDDAVRSAFDPSRLAW